MLSSLDPPSDAILLVVHPSRKFDVSASCERADGRNRSIESMVSLWDPSRVVIIHDPTDDPRRWYIPHVGLDTSIDRIGAASSYPIVWSENGFFDPWLVPRFSSARDVVLIGGCWSMCLGKGAALCAFGKPLVERLFFPFDVIYEPMRVEADGTVGYYGLSFRKEKIREWVERRNAVAEGSSPKRWFATFRVSEILDDVQDLDDAKRSFMDGPLAYFQGSNVVDYLGSDGMVLSRRSP